jgi:hypothetical protein
VKKISQFLIETDDSVLDIPGYESSEIPDTNYYILTNENKPNYSSLIEMVDGKIVTVIGTDNRDIWSAVVDGKRVLYVRDWPNAWRNNREDEYKTKTSRFEIANGKIVPDGFTISRLFLPPLVWHQPGYKDVPADERSIINTLLDQRKMPELLDMYKKPKTLSSFSTQDQLSNIEYQWNKRPVPASTIDSNPKYFTRN